MHHPSSLAGVDIDGWLLQRICSVDTNGPLLSEPLFDVIASDAEDGGGDRRDFATEPRVLLSSQLSTSGGRNMGPAQELRQLGLLEFA